MFQKSNSNKLGKKELLKKMNYKKKKKTPIIYVFKL